MSTHGYSSAELSGRLARVLESLTEAALLLTQNVAHQEFYEPPVSADVELDPGVQVEVIHVQPRPGRAGEPQRVLLWLQQRGPLPPLPPFQIVVKVAAGLDIPYEIGQRFFITLRPDR